MISFTKLIADELNLSTKQVENTIALLDDDKTIPFIARYRKEATFGLDEVEIFSIQDKLHYYRNLHDRKETILKSITEQGLLTPDLEKKINSTLNLNELEDIYLPFKPKKRTRAMIAREKGLQPLADILLAQDYKIDDLHNEFEKYIVFEKDLFTEKDVQKSVQDIIAEEISENADYRKQIREYTQKDSVIQSSVKEASEDSEFKMYFDYQEPISKLPPHRILALFRGEDKKVLKLNFDVDTESILTPIKNNIIHNERSIYAPILNSAIDDSYKRLIAPAIEREIRNELKEKAELHAIDVFGENLKNLLLQPPITGKVILGFDPGFRTGSKLTVVDKNGEYITGTTIYPHAPQNQWDESKLVLKKLIQKYHVNIIAIGNGTASRESEQLAAELLKDKEIENCAYIIVNEAGASVYSASESARAEFPDLDVSMRGAISIARRLQDPLAELVKIDPKSIGVGLYQHDVNQKKLNEKLDFIIEYCVNKIGVDINTSSAELLSHVSGLSKRLAQNIIDYKKKSVFKNRKELLKIPGIGQSTYEQCAGFLKIQHGDNPLDNTQIHPESYRAVEALIEKFNIEDLTKDAAKLVQKVKQKYPDLSTLAQDLEIGLPTLEDIIENIEKPGRDIRDGFEKPILRSDVLNFEDLSEGMMLKGTVRNVVDFGAFVDIGLKNDGLVHISELANTFVKNPSDFVSVGDVVDVRVLNIDHNRKRVGLSMKN